MTNSQQLPRLPVELVDQTVDFLHDDQQSLRACSSVSRTFLRSARYHLFHSLCVRDEPTKQGKHRYTAFLRFLRHTPEVCAYVRQLTLARHEPSDQQPQAPELCAHTLGYILAHLPRLYNLTIGEGVHFACQCEVTHMSFHHDSVKLQYLSLQSVRMATPTDLSALLRLFSRVEKLSVEDLGILRGQKSPGTLTNGEEEPPEIGGKLDVRELVLDTAHAHESGSFKMLSTTLDHKLDFQSLHSVTIGFDHQGQIEPFGTLMSRSADSLQHLTLRLPAHPYSRVPVQEWNRLQLPVFKELKSLTFVEDRHAHGNKDVLDVFSGEANRTVCTHIRNILQQPPTSLEQLNFQFRLRAFGTGSAGQLMDNFDWDELEETTAGCEALKRVAFLFQGRPEGDRFLQGAVENKLAVLKGRGMLQLEFGD